jgi:hypothetical protein
MKTTPDNNDNQTVATNSVKSPICVICGHQIKPDAKKCIQCDSYQSPLRRFFESINIQSLVALVPIVTLAFVFVKDQVVEHKSDVRLTIANCSSDRISIVASNLGNRSAILKENFEVRVVADNKEINHGGLIIERPDEESFPMFPLLEAGQTVLFDCIPTTLDKKYNNPLELKPPETKKCYYQVKFNVVAFDHQTYSDEIKCDCPEG